jgi:hypothetical protein
MRVSAVLRIYCEVSKKREVAAKRHTPNGEFLYFAGSGSFRASCNGGKLESDRD